MTRSSARKPRPTVTAREWDVIELARRDLTQKAIAGVLGISERTVQDRLARARKRAGVRTMRALLAHAGARPRAERANHVDSHGVESHVFREN